MDRVVWQLAVITNIYVNDEIVMAGIMDRLLLRESCNPVSAAYV